MDQRWWLALFLAVAFKPIEYCKICTGSLLNLAKHPASTVQILGAEKALFRAMKTKHDTPKYGLLYHASLVGQTNPKYKGKVLIVRDEVLSSILFA